MAFSCPDLTVSARFDDGSGEMGINAGLDALLGAIKDHDLSRALIFKCQCRPMVVNIIDQEFVKRTCLSGVQTIYDDCQALAARKRAR